MDSLRTVETEGREGDVLDEVDAEVGMAQGEGTQTGMKVLGCLC